VTERMTHDTARCSDWTMVGYQTEAPQFWESDQTAVSQQPASHAITRHKRKEDMSDDQRSGNLPDGRAFLFVIRPCFR
jgi:hypothetical protein